MIRKIVLRAAFCAIFFTRTLFASGESFATNAVEPSGVLVLIPRVIYVGDAVVMRYTFPAPVDSPLNEVFSGGLSGNAETAALPFNADIFESGGVTVTKMSLSRRLLSREQTEFTLEIVFIPWKTGTVSMPPIEVTKEESEGEIQIPPFSVLSLVEALGETELRPAIPPQTVPGTAHLLIISIAAVPLTALLAFTVARCEAVARLFAPFKLSRGARTALKRIKKLSKYIDTADDAECAREISSLVREYLSARFASPYTAFTPDETALSLSLEAGETGALPDSPSPDIPALLKRCEYIRFAPDSGFSPDERGKMLETSRAAIMYFDERSA